MSIEQLIEDARSKYTPEKRAELQAEHQRRVDEFNKRLHREFKDSIVTQELLNKVIDL